MPMALRPGLYSLTRRVKADELKASATPSSRVSCQLCCYGSYSSALIVLQTDNRADNGY